MGNHADNAAHPLKRLYSHTIASPYPTIEKCCILQGQSMALWVCVGMRVRVCVCAMAFGNKYLGPALFIILRPEVSTFSGKCGEFYRNGFSFKVKIEY